ncbi:2087_t:CDS:2, partial [Cetraspora pellucida]
AKFHIRLIPQQWYLDTLVEDVLVLLEPAIVTGLNNQSDVYEHNSHVETNELYKIYENFTKEMELELIKENNETEHNNLEEFAHTISNPISVRTKGRKSKRIKGFNDNTNISKSKNKKKQIPQVEYNKSDNDNDVNYKGEGNNVKEKKDNSEDNNLEEDNSEGIDSEGNNSKET